MSDQAASSTAFDFNPLELVELIYVSDIPEAKRLAYLSAIADGTFSMRHFDRLLADLERAESEMKKRKNASIESLQDLETQKARLQKELTLLEQEAADEQFQNVEALLAAAAHEAEQRAESQKQSTLETIQKKLSKHR